MTDNVLLHLGEEPRFDAIQTADIKPALQTAIAEARAQIAEVKAQTHTDWANTVERLTDITERVGRIWGVVSHLNSVVDTPELRAVYNELMPEITGWRKTLAEGGEPQPEGVVREQELHL